MKRWRLEIGDARDPVTRLTKSINSVITSPPYAERRKNDYPGVSEKEYPEFTVSWMEAIKDSLADDGSVLVVIKAHTLKGAVSDYVLRTRLAVQEAGWVEPAELIWWKPDGPPIGHVQRPRKSFENILWFAKTGQIYCAPKANGNKSSDIGMTTTGRLMGIHYRGSESLKEGIARCQDVVRIAVTHNKYIDPGINHPAMYPIPLAEWMIRLVTPPGGLVYDPFCGSGTTGIAALRNGFFFLGRDLERKYILMSRDRLRRE